MKTRKTKQLFTIEDVKEFLLTKQISWNGKIVSNPSEDGRDVNLEKDFVNFENTKLIRCNSGDNFEYSCCYKVNIDAFRFQISQFGYLRTHAEDLSKEWRNFLIAKHGLVYKKAAILMAKRKNNGVTTHFEAELDRIHKEAEAQYRIYDEIITDLQSKKI